MAIPRKITATAPALVILLFTSHEVCMGAEWSAAPSVKLREDYDNNVLLTTQPHSSVTSLIFVPKLDLGVRSDIWQLIGEVDVSRRRFPGHHELDTDGQNLSLGSWYKTERSQWQLDASSTRSSYVAGEKTRADIGLFSENRDSNTRNISPSWIWFMTELTQLKLAYQWNDVSYVNGEPIGIHDSHFSEASATLTHQYDLYTQVFFTSAYSFFRVPSTTFESKASSYQIGATRTFSATSSATVSVGGRNTSSEQVISVCTLFIGVSCQQTSIVQETIYSRDTSSIFNSNFDKQFEKMRLNAVVSRQFSPTATGEQIRTDYASLTLTRPFTAKMSGILAMSGYKITSETGGASGANDRRVYQIEPSLHWQWTAEWNMDLGYRYTHLQRVSETKAASSNAAYLTLVYEWPKFLISR